MKHIELLNEIKEKGGLKIVTVMIGNDSKVFTSMRNLKMILPF
jgi:hypothetical protein